MANATDTRKDSQTARIFKALGNETRLRIVHLLKWSDTALCVCELVDALQMPEYQVSRHLAALKKAGLVAVRKHGTWAYHELSSNADFAPLWTFLESSLAAAPFDEDLERLKKRLKLRAGDYCVVGFGTGDDIQLPSENDR